jgi:hypothetical protein
MFSQRNIFPSALHRSPLYEFEDIICEIDSVEVFAPIPGKWFPIRNRIANIASNNFNIILNPGLLKKNIDNKYDVFIAVCALPKDLLNANVYDSWRNCSKISVCLIDELWVKQFPKHKPYWKLLSKFDIVMLYYSESVEKVSEAIGKQCYFIPPGIDTIKFSPYPKYPDRVIDIYCIGRKSTKTHNKIMSMVREDKLFYVYDSIAGGMAINLKEHRMLISNMAKRSKYFVVNPGLIDKTEIRGDQWEMGNRYFEGAASGCVLIGEPGRNVEFSKNFNWPDAVINMPYNSENIDTIINDLNSQPNRINDIRRNNLLQSLKRHDWVYRWKEILKIAKITPLLKLYEREKKLQRISSHLVNALK